MSGSKLPERPSLEYLRKLSKTRLQELRRTDPTAKLATALLDVARDHGFTSWRALKAQIEGRRAKKIVSPAMRFLPVTNVDRSVAFYRDVLGFAVNQQDNGTEAVLGPARVRFGREGYAPADWGYQNPRPPGSAILFLQSEDIEATHSAIQARGGTPSGIENVNWIKMRMFEIRDPDSNVLWFGQSYHQEQESPSRRSTQPNGFQKALPEMPCDDVAAAAAYYRDILGFKINYQQEDLGVMDRDEVTVLLIARTEQHRGIGSFEVFVADVDALHDELSIRGARILGPLESHPWGIRDFRVTDSEGNRITFAQTFE